MRHIARILALIWAGWWTFFGLASGLAEGVSPAGVLAHAALPGLAFLAGAAVAWRWETVGVVLLILEGLSVLVAYPIMTCAHFPLATIVFVLLTMALPPIAAGLLFLLGSRRLRTSAMPEKSI